MPGLAGRLVQFSALARLQPSMTEKNYDVSSKNGEIIKADAFY